VKALRLASLDGPDERDLAERRAVGKLVLEIHSRVL